jgi:aquaporin Z
MPLIKKMLAEFIGTFWLVFGGCGSSVLAIGFTSSVPALSKDVLYPLGIGLLGVSLAFGLTVVTGAYAFGPISGGHFNPAVSLGLWACRRFPGAELLPYIFAQVLGGILGSGLLYIIASGKAGFAMEVPFMFDPSVAGAFSTNGFGDHSPNGYSLRSCFLIEFVSTFIFLTVILGATGRRAPAGFGGIAMGLALTLIHLISIPVTNTSVNPARSLAPALFVGGTPLSQVWLFWLAPILGALVAGFLYYNFFESSRSDIL